MHEYQKLINEVEKVLLPLGFHKAKEDLETDYCGSMFTIYVSESKRYMVEWDGEESFGAIQNWSGDKWVQFDTLAIEGTEEQFEENSKKLISELRTSL